MSGSSSVRVERATHGKEPRCGESARMRRYTRSELARHDGSDPALPVLIAFKGRVYDVSRSFPWARGVHWGVVRAGSDVSGRLKESIHGEEMLARVPCVGVLID